MLTYKKHGAFLHHLETGEVTQPPFFRILRILQFLQPVQYLLVPMVRFDSGHGSGGTSYNNSSSWGTSESFGENRGHSSSENVSHGYSEQMDYLLQPDIFSSRVLKTGGPENGYKVSAIWFQAGRRFAASADNWLRVEFHQ